MIALALVVGLVNACAIAPPPSVIVSSPRPTAPGQSGVSPSPRSTADAGAPEGSFGAGLTCPGDHWPPARLSGIAGIRAVTLDRAAVEITNNTDRTWYFQLSAWEVDRLESCVGPVPLEIERGPLRPGAVIRTSLSLVLDRPDLPVTIAFWDAPCGEACNRQPEHPMLIARSLVEPEPRSS